VVRRNGLPVTAPGRSIIDAAVAGTALEQIEAAVAEALVRRVVTPAELRGRAHEQPQRVRDLIEGALPVST
jgi:hypothetical protein